jgi:transcription elongation factor S-II
MVFTIKLSINGNIEEVNIFTKAGENYDFEKFKSKINNEENDFEELYQWELEKKKILKLFGKNNGDKKNENIHQLPISDIEYNYYGDLFLCLIDNEKYSSLDVEIFENIYNALYLNFMDNDEETEEEEEEENIFSDDNVVSGDEDEDEEFNIDNYGDNSDSSGNESDEEVKKPVKKTKKKKLIKTKEVDNKDIIYEEKEVTELKNITRIKTLEIFLSLLENKEDYFRDLERNLFNYTIKTCIEKNIVPSWNSIFSQVYINKARSLYTNMAPNSYVKNKRLLARLEKNEFTPEKLVNMSYQELFPENWKELIDEKYRRDKVLFETKKEAMTDQFQCKRCKGRETCYYEVQTRSADEPMTIFITCLNCGNRWKN